MKPTRKSKYNWEAIEPDMLVMSDQAVAEKHGMEKRQIQLRRYYRGIEQVEPQRKKRQPWTDEQIALLGKISDYYLARMRGVSTAAVFLKRQTLGIPPMERKQQLLGEWPNLVNIPQSEFIKKCCKHADIDYKTLAARCYVSYSRIQKWAAPGNGQEPLSMAYRRLIFLETHS